MKDGVRLPRYSCELASVFHTEPLTPVAWAYMGMEDRTEMREVAATKVAVCGRLKQFNSLAYAAFHDRGEIGQSRIIHMLT